MSLKSERKESKSEPQLVTLKESIYAVGLVANTSMKGIYRDLPKVYKKYLSLKAWIKYINLDPGLLKFGQCK
jgi:hypothetical protein